MNYYPFHIGDYASHTRHLSLMEDLAYRRLLDAYYLQEQPLNGRSTDVARMIGMRDHLEAVEYVLAQFFEQTEGGWINTRADEEIQHFRRKSELASKAGKASAERRSNARSTSVGKKSTSVEKSATDVQPTNNQNHNQIPPISPKGVDARFERFWLAYPKKVGKDAAKKKFEQRRPDDELLEHMLQAIAQQARSEQWLRDGGQYIPNPATWLNQGRWQDGVDAAPVNSIGVTYV